ncbi:MAG: hypothetical protein GC190_01830 [Alphaproteobacteria bacterium]|nr:hypothetical protein [Alphaproteobacteria bacterium]
MSSMDPVVDNGTGAAPGAPMAAPSASLFKRVNASIRKHTARYLNLASAVTLLAVASILFLCVALWDIDWLRPILATAGAGLAAFLGPIPGIISPEARSKWLVTIFVSALIAAGTWFATQDLANRLEASEAQRLALNARLDANNGATTALLQKLSNEAKDDVFLKAANVLHELQLGHKYQSVLDLAQSMLRSRPENGTALAYVGYAYRGLQNMPEAKKALQTYISTVEELKNRAHDGALDESHDGAGPVCYTRVGGLCAERGAWVEHLLAGISLRYAWQSTGHERITAFNEALNHEIEGAGYNWSGKRKGFDVEDEEPLSSCAILQAIVDGLSAMGSSTGETVQKAKSLRASMKCG